MYKLFFSIALTLVLVQSNAQDYHLALDTLPTKLLSEVFIQTTRDESDTLQNFFRANKSATTEDILSRLPGVFLIRRGSFGQEPMLRGMTGGQINVTLDGMKMFGACTDKMDPVTIYVEPQNLKSMQVNSGSNGARMGSTIGGSLDMQLAQPLFSSDPFAGKAGVGFQTVSKAYNAFLNTNFSRKQSAYYGSLNYRKAGNYKAGNNQEVKYSQIEKFNFSGAGKWRVGRDTLLANVLLDDGWNIGFPALPMDVGSAKARLYAVTFKRFRHHDFLQHVQAKVYYNQITHAMDDSQREDVLMKMDMPGTSSTAGMFVEGALHPWSKHHVSFRADMYYNEVLAEMTMYENGEPNMYLQTWPSSARLVNGLYIEDEFTIRPGSSLTVNARMDVANTSIENGIGKNQLTIFYPEVERVSHTLAKTINVSIEHLVTSKLIGKVNAGYGERLPTLSEVYGFYLFNRYDGFDYIGNPDLEVEKSYSLDASVTFFGNDAQVELTGFYSFLPDYIYPTTLSGIQPMTPGANGVKVYGNIESASMMGVEANMLVNIFNGLQLVSITKCINGRDYVNDPLPMIPPLTNITTLNYTLSSLTASVECEHASKQNRINESFGEDRTSAYTILNARISYQPKRISLPAIVYSAGAENVFDNVYHNHLDWGNIARPGRNFYVHVQVSF